MCKIWVKHHGQELPRTDDIIFYYERNVCIGAFISGIKNGFHKDLKSEIEKIFNCKIEKTKCMKNEWIEVCKEWIKLNGTKLPKTREIMIYKDKSINIGAFINSLKRGYNKKLKKEIEILFNQKIIPTRKRLIY
jgi:hypothetical protein